MSIDPISVFLSSPMDVQAERERAKAACLELQIEPSIRRRFRLDAFAFEDWVPPLIGDQPQQTVNRYMLRPDDADVLVCVLWSRMGSRFVDETGRAWESGTAFEFETALQRYQRTGRRPVVLLYRCLREPPPGTPAENVAQVERFFGRFQDQGSGLKGIFHHRGFTSLEEFAENLKRDLREVFERFNRPETADAPATPLDSLADRVGRMWIDGVLAPSLEGRPPLTLPLHVPPGPYLPAGVADGCYTGIWLKSLFRESKRRLVLTARAGAGKTVALLQLLQLLLQDRERGPGAVPVVLDATSWKETQTAREWILQELDRLYGARPRTARAFVENKQLIYLIDGIDQIGMRSRSGSDPQGDVGGDPEACRQWSNRLQEFLQEGEWSVAQRTPVLLCCREERMSEFAELLDAGKFQTVAVSPPRLADLVVAVRADTSVVGLADELEQNPQLGRLAEVPLFLQMLTSVFRGGSPYRPLANVGEREQIHELVASYVELRLAAEVPSLREGRVTILKVRQWLTWLARHQNRSPFLIELMQPDMLSPANRWEYRLLAACALGAALTSCAACPVALALGIEWGDAQGPAVGVRVGLFAWAGLFVLGMLMFVPMFLWGRGRWFGFFLAGGFSLMRGIDVGAGFPDGTMPSGWRVGLQAGLFTWVLSALVFVIYAHYLDYGVSSIVPLTNWNFDARRGELGVLVGIAVGAFFWLCYGSARGITFGTMTSLVLVGILCLRRSGFDIPDRPNHGIVRSTWNALVIGFVAVLIAPPVVAVSYGYEFGWLAGLSNGASALGVLFTALMFGGIPVLQHWSLRLVCAARGFLPLQLVPFLHSMTELMLIQRVGGGYRFSHDLIRGFFAGRTAPTEGR